MEREQHFSHPTCDYCGNELTCNGSRFWVEKDHREFQIMGTIDVCMWCEKEMTEEEKLTADEL